MADRKGRYGISVLDIKYSDNAKPDEVLIEGENGRIFYKREDGQIVGFSDNKYTKETLVSAMQACESGNMELSDNDFLTYHTVGVTGTHNMLSTYTFPITTKAFHISPVVRGCYVRFRGNDRVNSIVNFLENQHNLLYPDSQYGTVVFTFEVEFTYENETVTKTYELKAAMESLSCILFDKEEGKGELLTVSVKITGLTFPTLSEAFNSLTEETQNALKKLNFDNGVLEGESIDFISYVNDITDATLYDNTSHTKLEFILPMEYVTELESSVSGQSIIISEEKPRQQCIWGQLLKKPSLPVEPDKETETTPDEEPVTEPETEEPVSDEV